MRPSCVSSCGCPQGVGVITWDGDCVELRVGLEIRNDLFRGAFLGPRDVLSALHAIRPRPRASITPSLRDAACDMFFAFGLNETTSRNEVTSAFLRMNGVVVDQAVNHHSPSPFISQWDVYRHVDEMHLRHLDRILGCFMTSTSTRSSRELTCTR